MEWESDRAAVIRHSHGLPGGNGQSGLVFSLVPSGDPRPLASLASLRQLECS